MISRTERGGISNDISVALGHLERARERLTKAGFSTAWGAKVFASVTADLKLLKEQIDALPVEDCRFCAGMPGYPCERHGGR